MPSGPNASSPAAPWSSTTWKRCSGEQHRPPRLWRTVLCLPNPELAPAAARLHGSVDRQRVGRVLLDLLGRVVVGDDRHDLVERAHQGQLAAAELERGLAVER